MAEPGISEFWWKEKKYHVIRQSLKPLMIAMMLTLSLPRRLFHRRHSRFNLQRASERVRFIPQLWPPRGFHKLKQSLTESVLGIARLFCRGTVHTSGYKVDTWGLRGEMLCTAIPLCTQDSPSIRQYIHQIMHNLQAKFCTWHPSMFA